MQDRDKDRDARTVSNASGNAGGGAEGGRASAGETSTRQSDQPSALGGDVATRSGTAPTPPDEQAG